MEHLFSTAAGETLVFILGPGGAIMQDGDLDAAVSCRAEYGGEAVALVECDAVGLRWVEYDLPSCIAVDVSAAGAGLCTRV